nr:MAG TPA: hypothetical protein [Caudoviricetes sp.]
MSTKLCQLASIVNWHCLWRLPLGILGPWIQPLDSLS